MKKKETPKANRAAAKKAPTKKTTRKKAPPGFKDLPEDEKRQIIQDVAYENDMDCVLLENFSYPTGLVGYMFDDDGKMRAVYSEERMIEDLMAGEGWSYEEAVEWYEYNTVRGLPYCHTETAPCPIIIHTFDRED